MLNKKAFSKKMIITEKKENSLFSIYNPIGVKLLTRLRLQLSHLNEYKFRNGLEMKFRNEDTISPMCSCNAEMENNEQRFFSKIRTLR